MYDKKKSKSPVQEHPRAQHKRGGRAKEMGKVMGDDMMGRADRKARKSGGRATVASPLSMASSGTSRPQTKKSY